MAVYQAIKRVCTLGARHPLQVARLRVGVGIWLLFLTTVLYGYGQAGDWAWLLLVAAALNFYLAYRLFVVARRSSGRAVRLQ